MSHTKKVWLVIIAGLLISQSGFAAVTDWQKGGSISPRTNTEFGSDLYKQSLNNLKSTGANYVTLIIPYYQPSLSATTMGPGNDTPTDASLIAGINYAHSIGFKVNLKPHLQVTGSSAWRATVTPTSRTAWYASYEKMLQHYAGIAQAHGVEQITIGTELINMASSYSSSTNESVWEGIISRLRQVYSGHLTYSSNWGAGEWYDEKDDINFWDKLDSIGISAYFSLSSVNNPTSQQLINQWNHWNTTEVKPLHNRWNKPIIFTEIGYRSINGALRHPWDSTIASTYDEQEQALAYEALFSFWDTQPHMQGVHLWEWYSNPNAGGAGDMTFTPQNKSAQQVMTNWFGGTPGETSAFSTSTAATTANPLTGAPVNISTNVKNLGASKSGIILDVEIYNSSNTRVHQQVFENQSFAVNENKNYTSSWVPSQTGTYIVKVGLFNSDWSQLIYWNNSATSIRVNLGSSTPPPPPTPTPTPPPPPAPSCNSTGNNNFFACYFDNSDLTSLKTTRTDNTINFDWGAGSPDPTIGSDTFSARWQGNFSFDAANYDFNVTADDGVRVWIDNVLVLDKWIDQAPTTYTFGRQLTAGNHLITVEYYENGGNATAKLAWTKNIITPPAPTPPPPPPPSPTPTPPPPPPPTTANIDVWWPVNNATISGVQPFQAIINNLPIDDYSIHWQVDGGTLNLMNTDSSNGYAHKRSWVDVSGWWWKGNGPYVINLVAKNNSGQMIAQKQIQIFIGR